MKFKNFGYSAIIGMSLALTSHSADAQILAQPGETMGVALGKPLPEGIFFVDLESYGKRDGQSNRLGVNIPIVAWSTPFTFYDTRLEVLYAAPFTHIDGTGLNRTDSYSQGLLFILAHDFGNGFAASVIAGPRTPDNFTQSGRGVLGDFLLIGMRLLATGIGGPIKRLDALCGFFLFCIAAPGNCILLLNQRFDHSLAVVQTVRVEDTWIRSGRHGNDAYMASVQPSVQSPLG